MIEVNKLKGRMAEKDISGLKLARKIGITPKTFYSKMKKGVFGLNEIEIIMKELDIDDPRPIFFAKRVT